MEWTKDKVIEQLHITSNKGFIPIPDMLFRTDDGIVGQILEREFGVSENNLHLADLGTFELKGMRYRKGRTCVLTLFHQAPTYGMTPNQIFDRFGYLRQSRRTNIMKKKLFTTIRGDRQNNRGFLLKVNGEHEIHLYHETEYLATWDLSACRRKIGRIILAFAETKGAVNSKDEQFHYMKAYLLDDMGSIASAILEGSVVMDLSIDQAADQSSSLHDRGPHLRIPVKKLSRLYNSIEEIL